MGSWPWWGGGGRSRVWVRRGRRRRRGKGGEGEAGLFLGGEGACGRSVGVCVFVRRYP